MLSKLWKRGMKKKKKEKSPYPVPADNVTQSLCCERVFQQRLKWLNMAHKSSGG